MFQMFRSPVLLTFVCGAFAAVGSDEAVDAIMKAYSDMNYPQARKLAAKLPEHPEARLVTALCDLYDRTSPQIERAQQELALLFREESLSVRLRSEAGLSLARTAQLMKERRDIYGNAADIYDHLALFREVEELVPDSAMARDAFLYRIREELEREESRDAAFDELERFIVEFKGDARLLTPLRQMAEYEYIRLRSDYANAVRHLEAACAEGFDNPSEARSASFRLAFLCDRKLKDRERGIRYYRKFISEYPFAALSIVAKRFLKELGEESVEVGDVEEQ